MNIITIFLSDMHIKSRSCIENSKLDSLIKSVKVNLKVDGCLVIFGGDMTYSGTKQEFDYLEEFIIKFNDVLIKQLGTERIYFVMVPGNHDLNFSKLSITGRSDNDIGELIIQKNWDNLIQNEVALLEDFYKTARKYGNYLSNNVVDTRYIEFDKFIIRINLINSALFSTFEKVNKDNVKGLHYIPDRYLSNMENGLAADLVITASHHSNTWFFHETEKKLNNHIKRTTQILFNGHEHIQEVSNKITKSSNTYVIRGGEIGQNSCEFSSLLIDTNNEFGTIKNHEFDYERLLFTEESHTKFEFSNAPKLNGLLPLDGEFLNWLNSDEKSTKIKKYTDYFVFPDLELIDNIKFDEKTIIKNWDDFVKSVENKRIVYLESNDVSGKTTFLKNIIKNKSRESYIIYLKSDLIFNKNVGKIIKDRFEEQYSKDSKDFDYFKQTKLENKILLLDNLHKIKAEDFKELIGLFLGNFRQIFITIQSKVVDDEKNILKEIYLDGLNIRFKILPFYSTKRDELIKKVFIQNCQFSDKNNEQRILDISRIIESQISFFELSPNFIIMFVESFCSNGFTYSSNVKIFSSTFVASITNAIAKIEKIDTSIAERFLQELAYYMHKNKKYPVEYSTYLEIVKVYNTKYGKKIQHDVYFNALKSSKILENCLFDEIKFVNTNHLAFFVAKEIIKQFVATGDFSEIEYLLNNLCFGINSTILLFVSYLTDNENLIVKILDVAETIMSNDIELSFDDKNVPFLNSKFIEKEIDLPTKEEIDDAKEDKYKREKDIDEISSISKLDIYDYDEKEIVKKINRIIRNFKLIEIVARILPNFESSLVLDTKKKFVSAIYSYPNKMLYGFLKEMDTDQLAEEFLEEIKKRKTSNNKKKKVMSKEQIIEIINLLNISIILGIYDHIASISVNKETIELLDEFKDIKKNSNYKIQNLIMHENISNFDFIVKVAYDYYKVESDSRIKMMIALIVRKHIITKNIDLSGKNQKYIDIFFNESSKRKILFNRQKLITVK